MLFASIRAVNARTLPFRAPSWRGALVTLAVASAAPLGAQAPGTEAPDPADRTHLVKRGDTLWDLAGNYLTDPFLWPEIYRLNTVVVEDPHWIYPGERLRLPGPRPAGTGSESAPEPQPTADPEPQQPPSTVFTRAPVQEAAAPARSGGVAESPRRASREGEAAAAPWVGRIGGPVGQGRVVGSAELPGIAEASLRTRLQFQERIYVTLPARAAPRPGERYVVIALGVELPGGSQVVVPTGIIEVERVTAGAATTARIVRVFDEIKVGQSIVALERVSPPGDARAAPAEGGITTEVIWLPSGGVLPSLQDYVLLRASSADGVRVGDQFTLFRPRVRTDGGAVLPEETIALVQIVRVTERGATGLILDQVQPAIKVGTPARQTARMP